MELKPVLQLPRLATLYVDQNNVASIAGINHLRSLYSLSLSGNQISDLAPLVGLSNIYNLFLENNQVKDLKPLVEMAQGDKAQRFAPFLNVYLKGNPLSAKARGEQLKALKKVGTRVHR